MLQVLKDFILTSNFSCELIRIVFRYHIAYLDLKDAISTELLKMCWGSDLQLRTSSGSSSSKLLMLVIFGVTVLSWAALYSPFTITFCINAIFLMLEYEKCCPFFFLCFFLFLNLFICSQIKVLPYLLWKITTQYRVSFGPGNFQKKIFRHQVVWMKC